ncbi:MAG: O-antigen ligase family protein [Coleofasciculus sp. G1-WW12-02]|uniref:O-antigen ligase family protein n=1 Tax=Coleofasciculus sp. G1-WW12-02 TaxID=3068483 RepID=UPI0032F9C882
MLEKIDKYLFTRHPQPRLQGAWNCAQIGFFIFPWFPAVGAVGVGFALIGTWWQDYRRIIRRPLNWGLGILSLWLIFSATQAYNPTEAFLGLANFLPFLAFFAAFSALIQTPAQLRRLAWILVIPSVLVVILGFGQLFLGWAHPPQFPALLGWVLEAQGNPPGRMASVFMYANILAAYLQIVFTLGLGLWIETFQAWRQQRAGGAGEAGGVGAGLTDNLWRQTDNLTKPALLGEAGRVLLFLTGVEIANAIALILTHSRNAWGGVIVASLAFALYQGWRLLVGIVVAAAVAVPSAAFGPSPLRERLRMIVPAYFWARLTDQLHPDRPVALMRITQWRFALSLTQQRPWTGWGLRNFTLLYEQQMDLWLGHPHNLILMLTAEAGIPATILFCGLVGWIFGQGVLWINKARSLSSGDRLIVFSYLVAFGGCILFNMLDVTLFDLRVNTLGWLLLSAIAGVTAYRSHQNKGYSSVQT